MNMKILIIVSVIAIILFFVILSIIISKKRMGRVNIKIEDGKININNYLEIKSKLLGQSKKIINDDNYFDDYDEAKFSELDSFKLNKTLEEYYSKFIDKLYEDDELIKDKEIINLNNEIKSNDSELKASIKFYNNSVKDYNEMKTKFPTNFVKLFCGFKNFQLYPEKKTNSLKWWWISFYIFQLIGSILFFIRNSFVFENGLLPKKPLYAEKGDGWGDSII